MNNAIKFKSCLFVWLYVGERCNIWYVFQTSRCWDLDWASSWRNYSINGTKGFKMSVKKVGQDKTVKKRVTCKNCSAILEYLPKDVSSRELHSFGEWDGTFYYIICPDCKQEVKVR